MVTIDPEIDSLGLGLALMIRVVSTPLGSMRFLMKALNLVKFTRLPRKVPDESGEGPGRRARKNKARQGETG
jgi:hypothetical protein